MQSLYTLDDELVDAVFLSDIDDARTLLDRGADPDARDEEQRTLLMNATMDGHRDIVRLLLENGADPNLRDADQWSPLDVAVSRKALDLVWLLVQYGADVNAQDDMGISVLLRAIMTSRGSSAILDVLQQRVIRGDLPQASEVVKMARRFGVSLVEGSRASAD